MIHIDLRINKYLHSILALIFLIGCESGEPEPINEEVQTESMKPVSRDLSEIREDGKLNVILTYSSTSYFLYRGQPMGFEYELLKRMAEDLNLELNLMVVNDLDSMFTYVREGSSDLIAYGLTITNERKEQVAFTDYLYLTSQVLVQKKPDNWRKMRWANLQKHLVHDAIDLIDDTVSLRANSSYMERMGHLSEELGDTIYIDTLPGELSTEEIIKKVSQGEIEYTVADKNIAMVSAIYYPVLNIEVPISFSQRIAWALRKNSPELLSAINEWIEKEKNEVDYYVIYNKYFKNKRDFRRRIKSEFLSLNGNKISRYDDLVKKYTQNVGWDWRLLASLVYQESRFEPKAESWAGASGLMQIMPATARELGVSNPNDPEQSIKGGTKYLKLLYDRFDEIPDSTERIKFTMASYNCGYGHVRDAQRLAEKENLDKTVWDDNVEKMVMALSYPQNYNKPGIKYGYVRGIEPVTYVEQIFERYEHYIKFID